MLKFSPRKIIISALIAIVAAAAVLIFFKYQAPKKKIVEPSKKEIAAAGLFGDTYVNPRIGFTIHPPKDWAIDERGQLGTFTVFVPENPGPQDDLTSITVITEPVANLDDYTRETRTRLPEILNNFKLMENRRVALGKYEGQLIGGSFIFKDIPVRTLRLIVVKDNRGYNITATALQSVWSKIKDTVEESLLTFRP